ncbi:hypothetical protein ACU8V7_17330 [Zobellia nedashkovskayae]
MDEAESTTEIKVHPEDWAIIKPLPLDPAIEAQIDELLPKLTLEQKVGQVIQADNRIYYSRRTKKNIVWTYTKWR